MSEQILKLRKKTPLKAGDIIEVTQFMDFVLPEGETEFPEKFEWNDYDKEYSMNYSFNNDFICGYDFRMDKDANECNGDFEYIIGVDIDEMFPEIKEYELFDMETENPESESAKIRILSLH